MKNFAITFLAVVLGVAVVLFAMTMLQDRQKEQYINAAHITRGMASAMSYKVLMGDYWSEHGKLPCSDEDLDIRPGTMGGHQALDAMEISGCGQVTLTFNELSGVDGGTMVLTAEEVQNAIGYSLKWSCRTNAFEHITKYVPQCLFESTSLSTAEGATRQPRPATKPAAAATSRATASSDKSAVSEPASACVEDALLYRSVFTDAVEDRVPQKRIVTLGPGRETVFFFTEIIAAGDRTVRHRWFHNDAQVAEVGFDVKADRWRTWSSKRLDALGPGTLRVEVREGDCLIDQQSILIAETEQIDPAEIRGWKRPRQAFETHLARHTGPDTGIASYRQTIDAPGENGDTPLLAAIRRGDTDEALVLIRSVDYRSIESWEDLPATEIAYLSFQANPYVADANGVSPIDLAHGLGQTEVVEALLASITELTTYKQRVRYNGTRHVGKWGDGIVYKLARDRGGFTRFADGDTPLMRAIKSGNEQAVATLLQLGVTPPESYPLLPLVDLFAYDATGRQPLDIARDEGRYGIERLLRFAIDRSAPKWAVSRSAFATAMDGDEPADCRKAASDREPLVYFFTELTDIEGRTIRHDWLFKKRVVQSNSFDIRTQRWSVQSSRAFTPADVGNWDVRVSTADGLVLKEARLAYKAMTPDMEDYPDSYWQMDCDRIGLGAQYALISAHAPLQKIRYLADKGMMWPPKSSQGGDLFHQVISEGNITLTRWFLDNGYDIGGQPKNRMTPLMIAAQSGDVPMTLYLIKRGADVNQLRYQDRHTALNEAIFRGKLDVAEALIDHGANPNHQDKRGRSALGRAIGACNLDATLLLLGHGADPYLAESNMERVYDRVDYCVAQSGWSADRPELAGLRRDEA